MADAKRRLHSFGARVRAKNVLWAVFIIYGAAEIYWSQLTAFTQSVPGTLRHGIETVASWPWNALTVSVAVALALLAGPILLLALRLFAVTLLWIFLKPPPAPASPRTKPILRIPGAGSRDAKRAWVNAAAAWKAQPDPPDIADLRPPILQLKKQLDALASERETAIRASAAPETEDAQRTRYLGAFRIEDAKLENIGPARCAVLRSWGIDTAADIDEAKIAAIPGFGKNLTDKLVIWRAMKEKIFVPKTGAVIDPHDVQRIDRRLAARRTKLMKDLREKITEVERRMGDYVKNRDALWARVEAAYQYRVPVVPVNPQPESDPNLL